MKKGVILISVRKGSDMDNPYRTGGWVVIKDEAIERMPLDDDTRAGLLKARKGFLEDDAWDKLGLPREPT